MPVQIGDVVRYVKTVDLNMFQADIGEDHTLGVVWNLSGISSTIIKRHNYKEVYDVWKA